MSDLVYRPATDDDRERVGMLRAQAFIVAPSRPLTGSIEGFRVVERAGRVAATMRMQPVGQWFGGRVLPASAISSVAVAPEDRGTGVGSYMIRTALDELTASGTLLATLYASTLPTYRKAGFEIAGHHVRYAVPMHRLTGPWPGASFQPFGDEAMDEVRACYAAMAQRSNGMLDRPDWWWRARVLASTEPLYRFLVRDDDGRVSGYVLHHQPPSDEGRTPYAFTVACRDLVWTSEAAARGLLAYAGGQRALATDLQWYGPAADPLQAFVPEQDVTPQSSTAWLTRLLDVPAALEARGFQAGGGLEVSLTVTDPALAGNDRAYTVGVDGGRAKVVPAASARASVDVATLAALFTGYLHPVDAVRVGRLTGASDGEVAALAAMFAGPAPWMIDSF